MKTQLSKTAKPEISSSILRKRKQIKSKRPLAEWLSSQFMQVNQLSFVRSAAERLIIISVAKNDRQWRHQSSTERGRQNHDEVIIKFFWKFVKMTGLKQQFKMSEKTKRKKRKNFSKCYKSVKVITNNSEFQSSFSKMSKIVLMISILLQGSGKKNNASPFYSFTPYLKPLTFKSWINLWRSLVAAKCQTFQERQFSLQ